MLGCGVTPIKPITSFQYGKIIDVSSLKNKVNSNLTNIEHREVTEVKF